MHPIIRRYHPGDQKAVFEISADTAYFGSPVEVFLEDRELYIDAFARYYTDQETAYVWIAEISQVIVGFLLGCVDTARQTRRWRHYILSSVLLKAITGKYKLGQRTAGFAAGMLFGLLRGEEPPIDLVQFPAHLQIDVKQGFRGVGVGKMLIEAYLEQLRQLHVCGVHLATTSHNEAACILYEKLGFKRIGSHPNRFWSKKLGFVVDNRSYGLPLS